MSSAGFPWAATWMVMRFDTVWIIYLLDKSYRILILCLQATTCLGLNCLIRNSTMSSIFLYIYWYWYLIQSFQSAKYLNKYLQFKGKLLQNLSENFKRTWQHYNKKYFEYQNQSFLIKTLIQILIQNLKKKHIQFWFYRFLP